MFCTGFFKFGDVESGATMNLKVTLYLFSSKPCQSKGNTDIKLVSLTTIMMFEQKLLTMVNSKKLFLPMKMLNSKSTDHSSS